MLPTAPRDPYADAEEFAARYYSQAEPQGATPPPGPSAPVAMPSADPYADAEAFAASYYGGSDSFLPAPIPGVAEGIEAATPYGDGSRSQPTFLEQLGGVGRAVTTGAQQLLGGVGTAMETAGEAMQQPGIVGGPLLAGLGLPLEAVGETLARGSERYMANAQPAEIERQRMAEQSPGWGFAQDVAAQAPQLLAAAASGGGSPALAVLGASAAGQGIQQAEMEGATPEEAVAYGATSGVIEAATERFGKIPVVDKILKRAITGAVVKGGAIRRVLKDIGSNFGEEVAASVGQRIAALQTYDEEGNFSAKDVSEALYSGLVGAFVAGVPSAAAEIGGRGATPPPAPSLAAEAPAPQEAPGAPVTPQAEPVPVPEVVWPPSEQQAPAPPVLTVTEEPVPPPTEVVVETPPPPAPPVQPEPVVQPVPAVPQEAQDAQAAQADVAQPRQAAADAAPVAPEAVAQEAVLTGEGAQDALRRQEGREEGRQEVAPAPPVPATVPEATAPKGSGIVAGEKGMASTASVPYMQIPVATASPRAAAQKPLGTQGVVSGLSKLWDIPVRFRHFRKRAQAIFKIRPEVVRMREAGDLPAAAHEIAHYIDKTRPTLIKGAHKAAADELVALGKRLYNKGTHTRDFYESEGFAEYVRHRLTRDDAAQQAPEFDLYFNGAVAGDAELTQKLDASKQLYNQWRGQAPIERAKGQIDFDQELGKLPARERAVEVGRKTVLGMTDSWKPLDTFTKEMLERANRKREDLPAAADPYRLLAAFQGSESSIARQMMLHGVRDAEGTIIAAPVKEVMSKVKADDYQDFFAYTLAKRTIELEAKGKETGLSVDDAREIIAAHENADWEAAAKGLNAYANGLVDILQGAGALTQSQANKIKESEWYIPLTRVYEAESGGRLTSDYAGKQKQTAGGGEQPIQRLRGSTRPIQDPMLSLAQLTERVISAATRAKVFRAVYGLQDAVEGAGDIVEEVDAPKAPASFTLDKIRKQLEDMGIDVPADADGDALLTIFSNSAYPTGSDPIVTGVVNGQRKFLYVKDPFLYQSLAHMPPPWLEATRLLWPVRKLASAVRLGATGLNPGFGLITNFIRDAWTGTLQTVTNPGTFVIRMAKSAGRDTAADKLFYAGGGEMATPLGVDIKPFRKLKREIAAQTTMDEVLLRARHPIDSLRDLIAFTETFGRRAEFRRVYDETLKKTGDKESAWVAAQEAASEVTVNFRRAGIYGRALNQIIPFFNVAIQGPRAGVKAFQRNPAKAFLTATASLTVPALALYAHNRDEEWYQEIPVWEKAIFLHFKVGNHIIRLPLPFEWGILFATLPVAALDRLRTDDQQRFEESYGAMLDSLLPDTLPAGVRQAYEWAANVNLLTGRSIESERLERLLPEDRFYASTSEVYKKIGKMLGLSPVKIQNTTEGLTGGLSRTFTDPFKGKKVREAADIPVVGRLFSRQLRTGQSVTDIYNESERAEQVYASILKALEEGDQNEIDRLEKKYDDLLGVNPEGELKKGATRERYRRLYLLRDAKKLLKEAKGLDDPRVATTLARIMLGRDKLEDLPEAERKLLEETFDIPEPEDDED